MEYNLIKSENIYPLVLLPEVVKTFIEEETPFDDLCKEAGLVYPKNIERAESKYYFDDYSNFKYKQVEVVITKTIQDIDDLQPDYQDFDLENKDFYFGSILLPKKPVFKIKEVVKSKTDYSDDLSLFWFFILALFLGSSFLIVFGPLGLLYDFLSEYFSISYWLIYAMVILFPPLLFLVYNLPKDKNRGKVFKYREKLLGSEEEREQKLNEYKSAVHRLLHFSNQKIREERADIKALVENRKEELQKSILKKRLAEFQVNILHNNNNSHKRGRTELFFLQFLHQSFKSNVKIDAVPAIKNPFIPDFVVIHPELGLLVDVEIDEPYSLESGDVIHHDRSKDSDRNQFFTSHNWLVIRFSERQIVENPTGCVSFIEGVVSAIGKKKSIINTDLKIEPTWSYEDVHLMNLRDERRNYLSIHNL